MIIRNNKLLKLISEISWPFFLIGSLFFLACKTGSKSIQSSKTITPTLASIIQGKKVFENSCSSCHSFDSNGIGPSLAGISRELDNESIMSFISNPKKVIDSGDERSMALQKKYKTIMPSYFILGKGKIANLVAYINTYKDVEKPFEGDLEGLIDDPIPTKIEPSNFLINLEFAFQIPASNSEFPHTRITKLVGLPNNGKKFVNDINGKLYIINKEGPKVYMDMQALMPDFKQKPGWATGFGNFAFHPDFEKNGLLYTTHSEAANSKKADYVLPKGGPTSQLQWVIQEWKTNLPNEETFRGNNRELFRIDMATAAHGMQNIDFNPTAVKGHPDYGNLYIGIGDGGAVGKKAPEVANGKHTPWGSILRINPTSNNSENGMYGIPADNPFVNVIGEKVIKEVYANGFRNPHRFSWTKSGKMIAANIGQHNIESVYVIEPGANHGWPLREGSFGIETQQSLHKLYELTNEEMQDGITYPTLTYDHDEGSAICGGFVYTGMQMPSLTGKYIFGDILKGRLFYADENEMRAGERIDFKEMRIAFNGTETNLLELSNSGHAKLRLGQDSEGQIYLFSMNDGKVYRFESELSL